MSLFEFVVNKLNLEESFKISCIKAYNRMSYFEKNSNVNIIEQLYNKIISEKDNFYQSKNIIYHKEAYEILKQSLINLLQYQQILNNLYIKMSQNDNTYRINNNLYKLDFNFNNKDYINVPDLETMLKRLSNEKEINNIDNILNNIILTNDTNNININENEQKLILFNFFECYYSICFCINILHYFILNLTKDEIKLSYMNTMINLYYLILPDNIKLKNLNSYHTSIKNFIDNFMSEKLDEETDNQIKDSVQVISKEVDKSDNPSDKSQFMTSFNTNKNSIPEKSTLTTVDSDETDSDNDENNNNSPLPVLGHPSSSLHTLSGNLDKQSSKNASIKSLNGAPITYLGDNSTKSNSNHTQSTTSVSNFNIAQIFNPTQSTPGVSNSNLVTDTTSRPISNSVHSDRASSHTIIQKSSPESNDTKFDISDGLQLDLRVKHCLPILYKDVTSNTIKSKINNNDNICELIDGIFTTTPQNI